MAYIDDLKRRNELLANVKANPMSGFFFDQHKRFVEPFRIYGNVYFVGDSWVCVHLIDTGEGLLLIDSGNCHATAMLIQSIWEAGFNPRDVRWIIHSHGHVDHVGGARFFKNMFGTQLLLSFRDAEEIFRKRPEMAYVQDSPDLDDDIFVPDVEIRDGDVACILYKGSVYIRKARYRAMSKEIEFFVSEEKDPITIKFSESYRVIVGRLDAVVSFRNK